MRAIIPSVVTVLLVSVVVPVVGLFLFGVLTGTPQLAGAATWQRPRSYSTPLVSSFRSLCLLSVVAAVAGTVFGYGFGRQRTFWIWVFAVLGLILGTSCASPMVAASLREHEIGLGRAWASSRGVLRCGLHAMMSVLWYLFFRIA